MKIYGQIVQYRVNVSATYGRLNKSYYEPFQGFAYCILMVNIDLQKNNKIKREKKRKAKRLTFAPTGIDYLCTLQHYIISTVGFESTCHPHSP